MAGDTFCTSMITVYCIDTYKSLIGSLPTGASISVYVDDLQITVESSANDIVPKAAQAVQQVIKAVEFEMRCTVNKSKTELVTSCLKVAQNLMETLPDFFAHKNLLETVAARNLGSDYTAGRKCFVLRSSSVRNKRFALLRKRMARLANIKSMVGFRAQKIWRTGL